VSAASLSHSSTDDLGAGQPGSAGPPGRPIGQRLAVLVLVAAVYLGLSFSQFWSAWSHGPSHWLQSAGQADVGQQAFFLAQFPAAIIHGINPFANSWTNWPYGANYMANTAVPLLALVMAPVTLATSPIFSLNLLFTLTVWADCMVGYLVVRHFTANRLSAFAAGLLFGFSPMVIAGSWSHEQVVFDLLPPVMFLLLWRLCTGAGRPLRNGIALGVAMAVQLYVFAEPLGDCVVVAAVGLVFAGIKYRRRLSDRLVPLLRGAVAAAVSFLLLGGCGLYIEIDGPQHVKGTAHGGGVPTLSADLLSTVFPTGNQRFHLGLGPIGNRLTGIAVGGQFMPDGAETGAYVGFALLTILVIGAMLLWRRPLMRWAVGLAVVSFILSMGTRLRIDGHTTAIRLPFDVVAHLPLLSNAVAARFAMIEWFFLALMLGLILAELHHFAQAKIGRWRARRATMKPSMAGPAVAAVAAVAVVALLPLVPSWSYAEGPVPLPSLAVGPQLRSLPTGQVVLGYPFPQANTYLMLFQAEDKMRFRLVGGSLIQPAANGENLDSAAPPSTCESILYSYYEPDQPKMALTSTLLASCAAEMLAWNVKTVLWTNLGAQPEQAREFFTVLLGQPTVNASDSALWLDPQPDLRNVVANHGGTAAAKAIAGGAG
jgi:hypothetical protein